MSAFFLSLSTLPVILFIDERFLGAKVIPSRAFQKFPASLSIDSLRNVSLYQQCEDIIHPSAAAKVLQDRNLLATFAGYIPDKAMLPLQLSHKEWKAALELLQKDPKSSLKALITQESTPEFLDWLEGVLGVEELQRRKICDIIAEIGNCPLLAYAAHKGYRYTESTLVQAAGKGHLAVLQWLRAQDPPCPWDERACSWAARGGYLQVLQWLRAQDPPSPLHEQVCVAAAAGGHLEILQWLRAQDPPCPWDSYTCAYAAKGGHLAVLQWLRAQNPPCPWDSHAFAAAAKSEHLAVLEWLRTQR